MKLALACTGTVLVVLLGACGSDSDTVMTSSASGAPPRQPTRPPSTSSSSSSGDFDDPMDACPSEVSLTPADLDKEIGWKPSTPAQGSCSTTDLDQLWNNFSDTSLKSYLDLGKGLSPACNACVISKDTDAKWGPIVVVASTAGESGFVNYGACFGAIEGDACGKAIQYESFCTNIACEECAFTRQELAECVTKSTAAGGMCEPFAAGRTTSCPSWALNVKSCGDIKKAIETLCGPPQ
jgi:hypothetical protein